MGWKRETSVVSRLKDIAAQFHGRTEAHVKAHSISIGRVVSSIINLVLALKLRFCHVYNPS